jgi:hypothetical protein
MTESSIPLGRRTRIKTYENPIEKSANQIVLELQSRVGSNSSRLNEFVQCYKNEFKSYDYFRRLGMHDDIESDVLNVVKGPVILYTLKMNGLVIVDLAGLLERHVFLYMEEIFKSLASVRKFPAGRSIILAMLKDRRFPEVTEYLFSLGIWNQNEKDAAVKLYNMRNSIAHKNVKKIEDILLRGKKPPRSNSEEH